jgi:hypothetical protein
VTSGCANFALSTAILMVQAIAVSQPPPSAKPFTAANVALKVHSVVEDTHDFDRVVWRCPVHQEVTPTTTHHATRLAPVSRFSANPGAE